MNEFDPVLKEIIERLSGDWVVEDYQLAGMGWAAKIRKEQKLFTLHSERLWIDVYEDHFADEKKILTSNKTTDIVTTLENTAANKSLLDNA